MNENGPILFRTLGPVLGSKSLPTVMYDDEPAEGKTGGLQGHTKGVEVTDCVSGFWMIHTVPKNRIGCPVKASWSEPDRCDWQPTVAERTARVLVPHS
ncbi:deoxyribonuclease ii [Culex quinquefasciatus]|uniref:Deoxyribonuclease ii n=1 Tax=Culex quinquefasciatus TaxID=7176 RepID=B0XI77_CULQU|nr:deoxyribonuclease ii [Culex quinquefasciatus]|eukprot:XP_001869349.1 deoxyribonuclease ii [Culex quinquefasciatus]